jgi:hypothetical protein
VAWNRYGSDLGIASGVSLALGLATIQLFRTRSFATDTDIVQQRGLFLLSRRVTALAHVKEGRVVFPEGLPDTFGDVVLTTASGELRLRALAQSERVLATLLHLKEGLLPGRQGA